MGQSFEELKQYRDVQGRDRRETMILQLQQNKSEALRVSNLINDPNWEIWCRYVEEVKRRKEAGAQTVRQKILDTPVKADEFLSLKDELHSVEAYAKALGWALNVAKTIVEQGEKAIAELKLLQPEGE